MIAKLLKPIEVQITPHNFSKFLLDFEAALEERDIPGFVWKKDQFIYGILIKKIKRTGKKADSVDIVFDDGEMAGTVSVPGWKTIR